jgi:hypothetical protein
MASTLNEVDNKRDVIKHKHNDPNYELSLVDPKAENHLLAILRFFHLY